MVLCSYWASNIQWLVGQRLYWRVLNTKDQVYYQWTSVASLLTPTPSQWTSGHSHNALCTFSLIQNVEPLYVNAGYSHTALVLDGEREHTSWYCRQRYTLCCVCCVFPKLMSIPPTVQPPPTTFLYTGKTSLYTYTCIAKWHPLIVFQTETNRQANFPHHGYTTQCCLYVVSFTFTPAYLIYGTSRHHFAPPVCFQ